MTSERNARHDESLRADRRPGVFHNPGTSASSLPLLVGVSLYLVCAAGCLFLMLRAAGGHLVFTLDDAMIHMALSKNIAAGHYGINPGEPSSPSSSILWPFLLAIFGSTGLMPWWSLAINLSAGLVSVYVLAGIVRELPVRLSPVWSAAFVALLIFTANLPGLTFTGMEHTLQVALVLFSVWIILRSYEQRNFPTWWLIAPALAPLVRYEDIAITFAVAAVLWMRDRRAPAIALPVIAIAPLLLFSLFLRSRGLPSLPLSVLMKGGAQGGLSGGGAVHHKIAQMAHQFASEPECWLLLVAIVILCIIALKERDRSRLLIVSAVTAAALLHLLFGPFGFMHRYVVYILAFAACVILHTGLKTSVFSRPLWLAILFLLLGVQSYKVFSIAPACSRSIYLQQFQMGRILREVSPANAAVNDLGWVSYSKNPQQYVFDLVGLGSLEAAMQRQRTSAWQDQMAEEHRIGLVMRYRNFGGLAAAPPAWREVGELAETGPYESIASPCVLFFITPAATDQEALLTRLNAATSNLPSGVTWVAPGQCHERPHRGLFLSAIHHAKGK